MRSETANCHTHGHPEISLFCPENPSLKPGLAWLFNWIETEVARGRRFLPEQNVQIGWMLLQVRQRTDGTLGFFEPDMSSFPIVYVDSVSNTLWHLLLQKSVAESLGVGEELSLPPLQNYGIACTEFGATAGFVMSRVLEKGGNTGWFFGCNNNQHDHCCDDNLKRVSLYEAAVRCESRIIPYLGLPAGVSIDFNNDEPSFDREGKVLPIQKCSYLDKKHPAASSNQG